VKLRDRVYELECNYNELKRKFNLVVDNLLSISLNSHIENIRKSDVHYSDEVMNDFLNKIHNGFMELMIK
jgi:hypothetical protein